MKKPLQSFTGQAARRLRGLKHQLAGLQRAARRAAAVGCVAASTLGISSAVFGQLGQAPMAASGGLANRAVQGLSDINLNGAGRLYYGINAADRGLGYRGSYMTLGGYFPTVEDDLGGLWAADVRSHLSNYGGFFSNIGAVRKQLLGSGSLLGVGVYWDYDGDQNQYQDQLVGDLGRDPVLFPGGFSYNQVGVSGELLTDWGNLRSNGYIPLGSTGQSTGRFVSTNLLCMQGINAALGGADLEVGAYLPGLADWAGMINVGGYAYGNTRYQLDTGAELVPWFGGVFTRIDLTFAKNWDFSLQYNNDSYFDSTGFARLTYRLGGSRRRNVPDQMEQPMMRNEHIVRAHQEAEVAMNPFTGAAWRVIHVDNAATGPGNGSATSPLTSLDGPTGAETVASDEYDIIFVRQSGIAYANTGGSPLFTFANSNQLLIGEGSGQIIPTINCGPITVSTTVDPSLYPVLAPRPNDTAIVVPANFGAGPTLRNSNESISGFIINASGYGIEGRATRGFNTINDVAINGGLGGVFIISTSSAAYTFSDIDFNRQAGIGLENMGSGAIQLTNTTFSGITGTGIETSNGSINGTSVSISDTDGSAIVVSGTNQALLNLTASRINNATISGIASTGDGIITIDSTEILGTTGAGIQTASTATGTITLTNSVINGDDFSTGNTTENSQVGILIEGNTEVTFGSSLATDNSIISHAETGVRVTGNGSFTMNGGRISQILDDGVVLEPLAPVVSTDGSASFTSVSFLDIGGNGITTEGQGGQGGNLSFVDSSMTTIGDTGIIGTGIGSPGVGSFINIQNSRFQSTATGGIQVTDSNLRIEDSIFSNNASFAVNSIDASTTLISRSRISGSTTTGIQATASNNLSFDSGVDTGLFNDLTVVDNTISTTTTGVALQGEIVLDPVVTNQITDQGIVRANISRNIITTTTPATQGGGTTGGGTAAAASEEITLTTIGGVVGAGNTNPDVIGGLTVPNSGRPQGIIIRASSQTNLGLINGGVSVAETPAPVDPATTTTAVDYNLTTTVEQPPQ